MEKKKLLFSLLVLSILALPQLVLAAEGELSTGELKEELTTKLNNFINLATIIAGSVAVLLLIVVGVLYMQASDPVEKKKQADRIKTIIIGIIVIVLAKSIVNFVWG